MEGDEGIYVGGGVARRAAHNAERAANREARERGIPIPYINYL